jgi:hypothetical protein
VINSQSAKPDYCHAGLIPEFMIHKCCVSETTHKWGVSLELYFPKIFLLLYVEVLRGQISLLAYQAKTEVFPELLHFAFSGPVFSQCSAVTVRRLSEISLLQFVFCGPTFDPCPHLV